MPAICSNESWQAVFSDDDCLLPIKYSMNKPKFSITVPAYKSAFLKEAIDSCLNQTYEDYELIIVNDASPEDLESIVRSYLMDNRVHYYRNEKNCGAERVVDNWNSCLDYCTGEWVICMGDDDVLMPNCLEEYARLMELYPDVDIMHARVRQIDENGGTIRILQERQEYESAYSFIVGRLSGRSQYIGDFCLRTERLRAEGGYFDLPFAWGSDDVTSFICATPGGVANVNIPTFCYRKSKYSISSSGNLEKKLLAIDGEQRWLEEYVESESIQAGLHRKEWNTLRRSVRKGMNSYRSWALCENLSIRDILKYVITDRKYQVSLSVILIAIFRRIRSKQVFIDYDFIKHMNYT